MSKIEIVPPVSILEKKRKNIYFMLILNKFLTLTFFIFYFAIPLSKAQLALDSSKLKVVLKDASFEYFENRGVDNIWTCCNFSGESPPDLQPGHFDCQIKAQNGKNYVGMVGRDNGTFESIRQVLAQPLRANVCYTISLYLAKSPNYNSLSRKTQTPTNYNHPLKLMIMGETEDPKTQKDCSKLVWLAETLPIINDDWRKFTFNIKPSKDIYTLAFVAGFVVKEPYCGNILLDNISPIVPISCDDLKPIKRNEGQQISASPASQLIVEVGNQLKFVGNGAQFTFDTEGGRHKALDQLLSFFEKEENYKLVVRVKKGKVLSKKRVAYLYSYIFKNSNLLANRVEVKPYSPKDSAYFWTFENDDLTISFDSLQ